MNLPSIIKNSFIGLCILVCLCSFAQEAESIDTDSIQKSTIFSSKERQKLFAFSVSIHNPIATGDNFIGSALNGKTGYDIRLKMFVYKQFFVEYATTSSKFKVENKELVGDYKNTSISGNFLYFGYELLPLPNFKVGANVSFFGKVGINNSGFANSNGENQRDSGSLSSFGGYIAYDIHNHFSVFIDYSYRKTKTNINAPSSIENLFSQGTYHTIGLGLMLTFGKKDAVSTVLDYKL